jgi:hypothetical protein
LLFEKCQSSPLDDYVHAPDSYMNWTVLHTYELPDYVLYILNFTSQKWLDGKYRAIHTITCVYVVHIETFSDRPIWWHYLCISVPKKLTRPKSAFLLIDGGHNTDG